MGVVNTKSTIITNRDATPSVLTEPMISGGAMKEAQGYVGSVSGDSIASIYRFTQVPSNCRVSAILLNSEALSGSTALDIGAYYPTTTAGVAGAVISASFFGSAIVVSGAVVQSDVTNESGSYTIAKQEQPLWQALGISADPGGMIDICGTLTAASSAAGNIGVKVRFIG